MKHVENVALSGNGDLVSGFIATSALKYVFRYSIHKTLDNVISITNQHDSDALKFQEIGRRIRTPKGRFIELTRNDPVFGRLTVFVILDPEIPKPRVWKSMTTKLWYCNYDLCEGRGTTQRGAWNAMWERKLGGKK